MQSKNFIYLLSSTKGVSSRWVWSSVPETDHLPDPGDWKIRDQAEVPASKLMWGPCFARVMANLDKEGYSAAF